MSLIAKARHHLPYKSFKHGWSPVVASRSLEAATHFSQTATSKDDEDELVVEIDQRLLPAGYDPATFDPTNNVAPPSKRVWGLVDQVCGLTLAEANELSTIMMEKFCFTMMKKLTMKERFEILARKMDSYESPSKIKIPSFGSNKKLFS